jgi:hypothetical protein
MMSNTWTKILGAWAVQCSQLQAPGDVVTVTNRAGESKTVTLGANIQTNKYGFVYAVAQAPKAAAPQAQAVGDLGGVLALFARAKKNLKFPAICLGVPEIDATQDVEGFAIRLTLAGPQAKVPGSITVTTVDKVWNRFDQEEKREWLGRVTVDGAYQPARAANGRADAIARRLRELAQEPARVASEYGRLTACCAFCNKPLGGQDGNSPEGRKSLAVGYGRTCAKNYGLPWGEEKFSFSAEAV